MKDDNNLDLYLKETMIKNTNKMGKHKEEIWLNIENQLGINMDKASSKASINKERRIATKKKKRKKWILSSFLAASVMMIGLFIRTETGQALVNDIKQYFVPEKKVVQEMEGMPEENKLVLQETKAGYIIYIDEERYKLIKEDDVDRIVPKEPLEKRYPEVSMEISQVVNKVPEEVAKDIQRELKKDYQQVKEIETVTEPVNGIRFSAIDGNEWNSRVSQIYLVSNEKGGTFVIQEKYFLEAAEGHGARFYHMLTEFQIVE